MGATRASRVGRVGLALALTALMGTGDAEARGHAKTLGSAWKAYERGDFAKAVKLASSIPAGALRNDDYRLYVLAQSRALRGQCGAAKSDFKDLASRAGSRFSSMAKWRLADCYWQAGELRAAKGVYSDLLRRAAKKRRPVGDMALARYRVARAEIKTGARSAGVRRLRRFLIEHPLHPEATDAESALRELGVDPRLSPSERIERARRLTASKKWHESIAELEQIGDDVGTTLRRNRDYWLAMTLFKMRRQYARAGKILIGIYKQMGGEAARAMFHGARALSRADKDKEAIRWYERVVAEYPRSRWAAEAQYLAGWLEYNMGNYRLGIPNLEKTIQSYSRSRWARSARWFLGMSHYFLGEYDKALPYFERLAKGGGRLKGGTGRYWRARTLERLGKKAEAKDGYKSLIGSYPFSWYALLAHERLHGMGSPVGAFGETPRKSSGAPQLVTAIDPKVVGDDAIRDADELIAAGLGTFAAKELRRRERALIKKYGRAKALAVLMDRYRKAGNFNRPWMMAVVYGGSRALNAPPKGRAKAWWEHAYPRAYKTLVDEHHGIGKNPPLWLYSIMRKESGFDPNVHSYADARGLLQMIPATTRRVSKALGITYTSDLLFDPESNIKTGSWYIGKLFHKFKGQVPLAAGSFNSGPRPIMKWLGKYKGKPMDEWMELASYTQTREYMKKVTENYARYLYLYEGKVYRQPMVVDSDYVKDEVTY